MLHSNKQTFLRYSLIAIAVAGLSACGTDDDFNVTPPPVPAPAPAPAPAPLEVTYSVTVTNLTNSQPLSPVAVLLHQEGRVWNIGESSSEALEVLAEGGDNSDLLALSVVQASASGAAPIGPGGNESITVTIEDITDAQLSVVTMLVNTNDAFSGVNAQSLAALEVGDSWTTVTRAYDAGTEANSEAAGTIPGPVDGGTGFDATRDDTDFVSLHPGVVSADDGLTNSVLSVEHKFDNPVMRVSVTRMQ